MIMKRITLYAILAILTALTTTAAQPARGYRGFIDWNNSVTHINRSATGPIWHDAYYIGGSTAHGYQINPMWFVGAGIGLEFNLSEPTFMFPLYAEGRADLIFGRFTPFVDARLGYQFSEIGNGVYFSPSVGYRLGISRKCGLNLGLGLTLRDCVDETYRSRHTSAATIYDFIGKRHNTKLFFSFRLGIDF